MGDKRCPGCGSKSINKYKGMCIKTGKAHKPRPIRSGFWCRNCGLKISKNPSWIDKLGKEIKNSKR